MPKIRLVLDLPRSEAQFPNQKGELSRIFKASSFVWIYDDLGRNVTHIGPNVASNTQTSNISSNIDQTQDAFRMYAQFGSSGESRLFSGL